MPTPADDEIWMRLALAEARHGIGLTSPNPAVGAVLVKEGHLLGAGWHRKAGQPHAEVEALMNAQSQGIDVLGATAYVTLEPCSTHGRTGPCTAALIQAGVSRVVYGATDPNRHHAGAADTILTQAGLTVTSGVLKQECEEILRPFAKWITTGLPYVIAKAGQTLDGRLTRPPGEPQWITSEASRAHAMGLRVRSDAILIGGETLRMDNPRLTLRGEDVPLDKVQPWRVVVTRSGNLPTHGHLFDDEHRDRTLVLTGDLSFPDILKELASRQITTVLLESGGNLLGQAFAAKAIDEVCWYIAPRICGGGTLAVGGVDFVPGQASVELDHVRHELIGDNVCVQGYPRWD
ncbi:MAG TPA: bifunctional diaminohydroxyphosphoribosylaminopyrimidine deaminase/5-amino-6-(5-phosphoribosylamino)uracil reductase RibD [Verrucomicrobium sp.]|nr:bifunctional diaminohydroxyphosphoribosylaminopyrimidine deaminase/5-amino-6-(5-phosphoribosylamino)uracil reductase RibD [Verrucomicrobium sp.]